MPNVLLLISDLLSLITWSKHLLKYSHRSLIESLFAGLLSGLLTSRVQVERQHLLDGISKGATSTSAGGSGILQHPFLIYTPVPRIYCVLINLPSYTLNLVMNYGFAYKGLYHTRRDFKPDKPLMSLRRIQEMEWRAQIPPLPWVFSLITLKVGQEETW